MEDEALTPLRRIAGVAAAYIVGPQGIVSGSGDDRLSQVQGNLLAASDVVWEQLAGNTGRDLDFIEIIYPPHSSSTTDQRMLQHAGYEYGYVLAGELEVTVGFETVRLAAGDSIGFDSAVPHLIRNVTDAPARGIWVVRHVSE